MVMSLREEDKGFRATDVQARVVREKFIDCLVSKLLMNKSRSGSKIRSKQRIQLLKRKPDVYFAKSATAVETAGDGAKGRAPSNSVLG